MAKQVICFDCGTFWWVESYETVYPCCPECESDNWDLVSSVSKDNLEKLVSKEPPQEIASLPTTIKDLIDAAINDL